MMVAALYIDPRGPYPRMADVDCWDEARDARAYPGPWPVVAHPPCGPWGRLFKFSKNRHRECALVAVAQVRAYGGVVEHPAASKLWRAANLPRPGELPDAWGGYSVEVRQCDWGHVAEKLTWLYLVGVPRSALERVSRKQPTHLISTSRREGPRTLKMCSKEQSRRTPPEFAEYLVRLARAAGEARRAA